MSSQGVSKSTTLRGPKFDDEIDVKRVSTAAQVNTWKIVPCITNKSANEKAPFTKKCPKVSFTTKISNRFNGIEVESCDLDIDELNNRSRSNSADDIVVSSNKKNLIIVLREYFYKNSLDILKAINRTVEKLDFGA